MCVFVFVNLLPISCHPLTIFTCPCHWSASLPGIRLMTVAGSANVPPLLHLPCSTVWSLIRKRWKTGEKSSQLKKKDTQYTWRIMNVKKMIILGQPKGATVHWRIRGSEPPSDACAMGRACCSSQKVIMGWHVFAAWVSRTTCRVGTVQKVLDDSHKPHGWSLIIILPYFTNEIPLRFAYIIRNPILPMDGWHKINLKLGLAIPHWTDPASPNKPKAYPEAEEVETEPEAEDRAREAWLRKSWKQTPNSGASSFSVNCRRWPSMIVYGIGQLRCGCGKVW